MANELSYDNIVVVNAPAGSGKTYRIKSEIREYTIKNPQNKILCITYTNRAADELLKGIDSPNVYISTIHSYINDMISSLFGKQEIIDLYFEIYADDILRRINNPQKQQSNNKYKKRFGEINLDIIKSNVRAISYNKTQFNSLYYGGLSHDDLLSFTYKVLERYPKLYGKINKRFKVIIIDEYQDTSSEVFNIFFNAVKNTEIKLYLYGDKMQQIYKLYNSELNYKLVSIKQDDRKIINHRSIPVIVDILNKIYNNMKLDQGHFNKLENIQPDFEPRIIIAKSTEFGKIIKKIINQDSKTLVLYIFNRERFAQIGAGNLFKAFSNIDKYGFGKKISATEILLNGDEKDNQDDLLKFMIIMYKINDFWQRKTFGSFLKKCRDNKKIFNIQSVILRSVEDKKNLYDLWKEIFEQFNNKDITIGQLINLMNSKNLLEERFIDTINANNTYSKVINVPVCELVNLENSNANPNVSTQHGVKGESHDSVVFVAEDSKRNNPRIYMYDFFKVWTKVNFSLDEFEEFYFKYFDFIKKVNCINKDKEYLITKSNEIIREFDSNKIFNILCKDIYNAYLKHPIKKNADKLFKDNTVRSVLSAYKLFYVGCSRARKNLTVIVDEDKITEYEGEFREKLKNVGFSV
ncbi:UvrD-helicase domain-containing protein [Haloimpatiens sp. FM7330]|uniref:UvrD-helicase domain-containing protein n=1 Tax=Haloimpatiens sp. FM7330 TaxID=3298610 RepID=UPI00363F1FF4